MFAIVAGLSEQQRSRSSSARPVLEALGGRAAKRSSGAVLAGKSILNRLEHAAKVGSDSYHKITHDEAAIVSGVLR